MLRLEVELRDPVFSGGRYDLLAESCRDSLVTGRRFHVNAAHPVRASRDRWMVNLRLQGRNGKHTALTFGDQVKRKGVRGRRFKLSDVLRERRVALW
jgi:hypothetical protein